MSERPEVSVVGSGPAGLAAAIALARAGVRVTVYEKGPTVGTRFHGDFQGLENWSREQDVLDELQAMGLEVNFTVRPRYCADFYDAAGRLHPISMKEPFFYLVHRGTEEGSLDRGLYAQAQEAGVRFCFNRKLDQVEGPVIVATGPRYADGICVGYVFETDLEDLTVGILSYRLAPRGYSYLLVADGRATLVSCLFADLPHWRDHLDATVETFQKLFHFEMRDARFFSGYGNVFARKHFREGQKLYAGEAAGLQDGLWGFGMRFAMRSGHLAAQSLLRAQDYEQLVRKELLPYHRAGLVNRFLWDLMSDRLFAFFLGRAERWTDARKRLRQLTGPHPLKDLFCPFVWSTRGWQVRYRDESCQREDCTCVWCACVRNSRKPV
jgi:flavin-dependent dehydrogenase